LQIKVILFDLDDTLYDEKLFVKSGFKEVSKYIADNFDINKKDFYKALIKIFNRGIRGKVFDNALDVMNIPHSSKLISEMLEIYREHHPNIRLNEDVKNLLKKLHNFLKLGIITDGYLNVQKNKVNSLSLNDYFDNIIYTDQYGRNFWKPNVYCFELALKFFCITSNEVLYIGDNPYKDFIGAKKIGISTIRIRKKNREFSKIDLDQEHQADYEIKELKELFDLINQKI
jgi:putative hydrolase of the HAD superfamily